MFARALTPVVLFFAALTVAVGGCEFIATADRSLINAGGNGGDDSAGGGGATGSCVPEDCPGNDTPCRQRACAADGTCTTADAAEGATCSDSVDAEAKVCDGVGSCVQCVSMDECLGSELCIDLLCVPATCVNGDLDGDESDVDCGGSCAPCVNGLDCGDRADCVSHFCDTGTCAACAPGGTDCADGLYCDGGECLVQLIAGDVCTDAAQCLSGFCPAQDGICCDAACDSTCLACLNAKNGGAGNGACAPVPLNEDPDTECPLNNAICQAAGCDGNAGSPACNVAGDSVVCRPGSGDMCDPDEQCSSGSCPTDTVLPGTTDCRPGSGDSCDPTETCPGTAGMACPADAFSDASTLCSPKIGNCDVADNCPGVALVGCVDTVAAMGALGNPGCEPYVCDGTTKDCLDECDGDEDCDTVGGFTCKLPPGRCE